MIDERKIILSEEELRKCQIFSQECAKTQQRTEFGQSTEERSIEETARDNLIGKIAEVAFSKLMKENYGANVSLDFNYYPRGKWDTQDAEINGWRIDVKGTRTGGRWMLIDWGKLNFRQKENKLSHVYVMFTVGWNRDTDQPTGYVEYKGFVTLARLRKEDPYTHTLPKDSLLPGTSISLTADNYGILFEDLYYFRDSFDGRYSYDLHTLLENYAPSPNLTDNFKNPYTGKTTIEMNSSAAL